MQSTKNKQGFTLIELLTVIAIIGILAAIIIPSVGAVQTAAKKSRTKAQFSQWTSSLALFKQEYGYYPTVTENNLIKPDKFIGSLSGKDYKGEMLKSGVDELAGNKKRIGFYSFSESDILVNGTTPLIVDAFLNSDIVLLIDSNNDGLIKGTEFVKVTGMKSGNPRDGDDAAPDAAADNFPTDGIRTGTAFYSVGKGSSSSDYVYSWK
ncbi:MAG: hypothetical protein RL376_1559 [Verrucomicrobiota bacterium]|jgi:prepilin-type N-terminal cleavage/methylation domain-containing protein